MDEEEFLKLPPEGQKCLGDSWVNSPSDGLYCNTTWDTIYCWPATRAGHTVREACATVFSDVPDLVNYPDAFAYRECDQSGMWVWGGWTNYSQCLSVIDNKDVTSGVVEAVRYITFIGALLSLFTLTITIFIFTYFRTLECDRLRVHRNLVVSLIIRFVVMLVLTEPFVSNRQTSYRDVDWLCKTMLAVRMYAQMASINWMFVEGLFLHSRLTSNVFDSGAPFPLYYTIGWGLPLVFIVAWTVTMSLHYPVYCWKSYGTLSYIWILVAPMVTALIINLLFLINIIRVLTAKLNTSDGHVRTYSQNPPHARNTASTFSQQRSAKTKDPHKQQHLQQLQAKQLLRDNDSLSRQQSLSVCAHNSQVHIHQHPIRAAFHPKDAYRAYRRHRSEENLHKFARQRETKYCNSLKSKSVRDKSRHVRDELLAAREGDGRLLGGGKMANGLASPALRSGDEEGGEVKPPGERREKFLGQENSQKTSSQLLKQPPVSNHLGGNEGRDGKKDQRDCQEGASQNCKSLLPNSTPKDRQEEETPISCVQESRKISPKRENGSALGEEQEQRTQQTPAKSPRNISANSFQHHPSLGYAVNRPEFNLRKAIKATIVLFPLLGITNLLFAVNPGDKGDLEGAYMIANALLQSSQGVFVSVLYCFLNTEVRRTLHKRWRQYLVRLRGYPPLHHRKSTRSTIVMSSSLSMRRTNRGSQHPAMPSPRPQHLNFVSNCNSSAEHTHVVLMPLGSCESRSLAPGQSTPDSLMSPLGKSDSRKSRGTDEASGADAATPDSVLIVHVTPDSPVDSPVTQAGSHSSRAGDESGSNAHNTDELPLTTGTTGSLPATGTTSDLDITANTDSPSKPTINHDSPEPTSPPRSPAESRIHESKSDSSASTQDSPVKRVNDSQVDNKETNPACADRVTTNSQTSASPSTVPITHESPTVITSSSTSHENPETHRHQV